MDDIQYFKKYIKKYMAGTLSESKSYHIRRLLKRGVGKEKK
tara:strand:+ start:2341 stop:2463 length:123 start_codon:yes stop_codon:yes gene_type:complete